MPALEARSLGHSTLRTTDASSHELKVRSGHFAYSPVDQRQINGHRLGAVYRKKICAMVSWLLRYHTEAYCGSGLAVAAGAEA